MQVIKFSDFVNGKYGEYKEKRSLNDTLITMLVAMMIVYFAPYTIHAFGEIIRNVFIGVGGM